MFILWFLTKMTKNYYAKEKYSTVILSQLTTLNKKNAPYLQLKGKNKISTNFT